MFLQMSEEKNRRMLVKKNKKRNYMDIKDEKEEKEDHIERERETEDNNPPPKKRKKTENKQKMEENMEEKESNELLKEEELKHIVLRLQKTRKMDVWKNKWIGIIEDKNDSERQTIVGIDIIERKFDKFCTFAENNTLKQSGFGKLSNTALKKFGFESNSLYGNTRIDNTGIIFYTAIKNNISAVRIDTGEMLTLNEGIKYSTLMYSPKYGLITIAECINNENGKDMTTSNVMNFKDNKWNKLGKLNDARVYLNSCFISDDNIFVIGGFGIQNRRISAEIYNLETNKSEYIKPCLHCGKMKIKPCGICYWKERNSVVIASDFDGEKYFEEYNFSAKKWTQLASLNFNHSYPISLSVYHDCINFGTEGCLIMVSKQNIELYNPNQNKWINLGSLTQLLKMDNNKHIASIQRYC